MPLLAHPPGRNQYAPENDSVIIAPPTVVVKWPIRQSHECEGGV